MAQEKLKAWIAGFDVIADTDLSTLALVKIVEVLRNAQERGIISDVERQDLHKFAIKTLNIEV